MTQLEQRAAGAAEPGSTPPADATSLSASGPPITRTQTLTDLCARAEYPLTTLLGKAEVKHAEEMDDQDYSDALAMLRRRIEKREAK